MIPSLITQHESRYAPICERIPKPEHDDICRVPTGPWRRRTPRSRPLLGTHPCSAMGSLESYAQRMHLPRANQSRRPRANKWCHDFGDVEEHQQISHRKRENIRGKPSKGGASQAYRDEGPDAHSPRSLPPAPLAPLGFLSQAPCLLQ